MKRLFVAVALVMGLGTSVAWANNLWTSSVETVIPTDEYIQIELKYVPQAITDAVAKNYEGNTIKEHTSRLQKMEPRHTKSSLLMEKTLKPSSFSMTREKK